MSKKVNIILVHGAWADGSSWRKVIPLLAAECYNVSATQQPFTSLSDDVEIVRRSAEVKDGPTLLVGHSYGGAIITEAANKSNNIVGLIYIAAFAPEAGESLGDLGQRTKPAPGNLAVHPDKYGILWIDKEKFRESFCRDVEEEEATIMAAVQKPIAIQCFTDKLASAGWKHLPCWYQLSEEDRMIAPETQQFMSERIKPIHHIALPTGHASMVSHPREIAGLILNAANYLQR